jgi:hypothetical protein
VGYGGWSVALGGAGSGTFGPLISPTSQFAQPMGTMGLVYGISGSPGGNVGGLGEGAYFGKAQALADVTDTTWTGYSAYAGMSLQQIQAAWASGAMGPWGSAGAISGYGPRQLHAGGIVDHWHEYQSGGTVAAGEGVFTPTQMAALAPAAGNITSVAVTVINNQATTRIRRQFVVYFLLHRGKYPVKGGKTASP